MDRVYEQHCVFQKMDTKLYLYLESESHLDFLGHRMRKEIMDNLTITGHTESKRAGKSRG